MSLIIKSNYSLKKENWFNTGGDAEFFVQPENYEEVKEAIFFSKNNNLPITILGLGANILISDKGIDGLVIRLKLNSIKIISENENFAFVEAQAGVTIEDLILWGINNQLLGLEEFSGIPSSIGGALYINLHYFSFFIADFLEKAIIFDKETDTIINVSKEWFEYGYDKSKLFEKKHIILSGIFKLKKSTAEESMYAKGRSVEIIRHRKQRYPYKNTCGSFFRNFHNDEVSLIKNGKKIIYSAYYLDKIGVRGELEVGGASVSYQHANMIVTSDNATSSDVIRLAKLMQEEVKKKFNILLIPECEFLGFDEYPLWR